MLKISKKSLSVQLIIVLVAVIGIFAVVYFTKPQKVEAPVVPNSPDVVRPVINPPVILSIDKIEQEGLDSRISNYIKGYNFGDEVVVQLLSNGKIKEQFCAYSSDKIGKSIILSVGIPEGGSSYYADINQLRVVNYSCSKALTEGFDVINNLTSDYKSEIYNVSLELTDDYYLIKYNPLPIACTMDAMMCPDGSYVGRSGPKCEFVCPK